MKKFVITATVAVAIMMTAFIQPAKANGGPYVWFSAIDNTLTADNKFNISLDRQESEEKITVHIENPGKKNLSISLHGPDGVMLDNFFTGRKFVKMSKDYNFSDADEGMYTLVVSDGAHKITRHIKFARITPKSVSQLIIQ